MREIINNHTIFKKQSFLQLNDEGNKLVDENYLYVKNLFNEPQIKDFVNEFEKKDFNVKRLETEERFQGYAKENEKNAEKFFNLLEKSANSVEEDNKHNLVFSFKNLNTRSEII